MAFVYQKRDRETLKERANMKGGNFDTIFKPKFKQWKPKEGKNTIRILPPSWKGAKHYGLDIFVNYNIGPDNQSFLSLSKHEKGADPIEEAKREAQREGEKDFAKKLNWTQRILYWIIDRNDEDEGPLLWAAPFTFDKSLSNLCIDEDTKDVTFIDDPAEGNDVRFYREGTKINTKYDPSKMKVLKTSFLSEDEGLEQDWLDFIKENPLPDVLNFYDYDHIKATFDGQIGSFDDDDDDKPATRKRKPSNTDDEDNPPPKRTRRAVADPDDDPPADDKAKQRTRRQHAEPPEDDDVPPPRRRRSEPVDEDPPDDPPPRRRAVKEDPPDDPPPRRRARAEPENHELEESLGGKRRARAEPEDDDPPSTRRTSRSEPKEESNGSLRDKLAARRSRVQPDPDDDD